MTSDEYFLFNGNLALFHHQDGADTSPNQVTGLMIDHNACTCKHLQVTVLQFCMRSESTGFLETGTNISWSQPSSGSVHADWIVLSLGSSLDLVVSSAARQHLDSDYRPRTEPELLSPICVEVDEATGIALQQLQANTQAARILNYI